MKFCANCGSMLPESGVCSSCGTPSVDPNPIPPPTPYAPPPPVHHAMPPPPPMHHMPPTPPHHAPPPMHHGHPPMHHGHPPMHHYHRQGFAQNPFDVALEVVKQFFTRNPENSIATALNAATNTWFVFLGVFALISAIAVTVIYGQLIAMLGFIGAFMPDLRAMVFIVTLVVIAIVYFIQSGFVMLVFVIYKTNISFLKVMDLVAVTYVPIIVSIAVGFILGLIYLPLGLVVVMLGSYGHIVMLYRGMQEVAGEGNSIFWGFIGMYAVYGLIPVMMI